MKTRTTREDKKKRAIEVMKKMDIYEPYIEGFEKRDQVCFFEMFGGDWVDQEPEVYKKMKWVEEEFNCLVYAITHEYTEFGECYSFLIITDYKCEWKNICVTEENKHYAFAYVWNKDVDYCSEFGTVGLQSLGGGTTRVS